MSTNHDHQYQFFEERFRKPIKEKVISDAADEIEPRFDYNQHLDNLFYDTLCLDSSQHRRQNVYLLKDSLLSCTEEETLKCWLPTVYRLSKPNLCPFAVVRQVMQEVLDTIKHHASNGVHNPINDDQSCIPRDQNEAPSRFISHTYTDINLTYDQEMEKLWRRLLENDEDNRELQTDEDLRKILLLETWHQFHRIDNLSLTLAIHPKYFDLWRKFHTCLIYNDDLNDGLKRIEKIYIAIMAASVSKSTYLYFLLVNEFKLDRDYHSKLKNYPGWIEQGYAVIPQKFKDLCQLNELMASSPWLISSDLISKLTVRCFHKNSWRTCDLVQAIVIMAWIHSNASFCYGVGINSEIDAKKNRALKYIRSLISNEIEESESEDDESDTEDTEIIEVIERMKRINRERTESESRQDVDLEEEQAKNYTNYTKLREYQNDISDSESDGDEIHISQELLKHLSLYSKHQFYHSLSQVHNNINTLNEDTELRLQDFNWKSKNTPNALDIISDQLRKIDNDLSILLDDKFALIQKLTYNKIGKKKADTELFRYGVWNFAQCQVGIMLSDCNYDHLEQLLDSAWCKYLNKIMVTPHQVTRQDYASFCRGLENDEKVHVNLLCLEARFQAELLYAMRALSHSSCHHY